MNVMEQIGEVVAEQYARDEAMIEVLVGCQWLDLSEDTQLMVWRLIDRHKLWMGKDGVIHKEKRSY